MKKYHRSLVKKGRLFPVNARENFCDNCKKRIEFEEIYNWKCSGCCGYLSIKIELHDGSKHLCFLLLPEYLSVGDLVSLDGRHCYYILFIIEPMGSSQIYKIGLKGFGHRTIHKENVVALIF